MNRMFTVALGLAVAALPVLGLGVAAADDDSGCDAAKTKVSRVEVRLASAITAERTAEKAAVDKAKGALEDAQALLDKATGDAVPAARAARDAAKGALDAAKDALNTDSKRLADLRVELKTAQTERDKACDDDQAPSTTPAPTTTPAADNDVDCSEVSDARAQEILDADRSDPNNLDDDHDGVACEEDVTIVHDREVVTPSGGVQTDGGVE
jgi:hypothetical protein